MSACPPEFWAAGESGPPPDGVEVKRSSGRSATLNNKQRGILGGSLDTALPNDDRIDTKTRRWSIGGEENNENTPRTERLGGRIF